MAITHAGEEDRDVSPDDIYPINRFKLTGVPQGLKLRICVSLINNKNLLYFFLFFVEKVTSLVAITNRS